MSFPEPLRIAGSFEKRVLQDCGLMLSLLGSKGSHFNLFIILKQLLCAKPCSVASVTTVNQIHRHPTFTVLTWELGRPTITGNVDISNKQCDKYQIKIHQRVPSALEKSRDQW